MRSHDFEGKNDSRQNAAETRDDEFDGPVLLRSPIRMILSFATAAGRRRSAHDAQVAPGAISHRGCAHRERARSGTQGE